MLFFAPQPKLIIFHKYRRDFRTVLWYRSQLFIYLFSCRSFLWYVPFSRKSFTVTVSLWFHFPLFVCVCVWQIRQSGVRASAPDFALSASLARAKIESTFKRVLKNQEQLAIEMKPANRRMNQQGIQIERKKEPKYERNNNVHISTWYASPRANIKRTMST